MGQRAILNVIPQKLEIYQYHVLRKTWALFHVSARGVTGVGPSPAKQKIVARAFPIWPGINLCGGSDICEPRYSSAPGAFALEEKLRTRSRERQSLPPPIPWHLSAETAYK